MSETYDFYHIVPRMWLKCYNENGIPLSDSEIKEDIMNEYIQKTVTFENHPLTGIRSISILTIQHVEKSYIPG
jgi:ubiquitin-like-conjugating enzyme ATG3